jgi:norsolorinic acid ketoreductase
MFLLTYAVTGASRGIGFQLVQALSSHPETVVFAGAHSTGKEGDLFQLAAKKPNTMVPIKITSDLVMNNETAA